MARRVSLPSADELFRPTGDDLETPTASALPEEPRDEASRRVRVVPDVVEPQVVGPEASEDEPDGLRKPSGRIRHDEKMTVYVTSEELLEIEHARLSLRGRHRLVVDRGRLVREALALVLADLDANGEDSMLVRRLTE